MKRRRFTFPNIIGIQKQKTKDEMQKVTDPILKQITSGIEMKIMIQIKLWYVSNEY